MQRQSQLQKATITELKTEVAALRDRSAKADALEEDLRQAREEIRFIRTAASDWLDQELDAARDAEPGRRKKAAPPPDDYSVASSAASHGASRHRHHRSNTSSGEHRHRHHRSRHAGTGDSAD